MVHGNLKKFTKKKLLHFFLQIFLKYLLCGRHGLGTWDTAVSNTDKKSCPRGAYPPAGETEIVNITTEPSTQLIRWKVTSTMGKRG